MSNGRLALVGFLGLVSLSSLAFGLSSLLFESERNWSISIRSGTDDAKSVASAPDPERPPPVPSRVAESMPVERLRTPPTRAEATAWAPENAEGEGRSQSRRTRSLSRAEVPPPSHTTEAAASSGSKSATLDAPAEIDKAAIEQQLRVVDAAYKVPEQLSYKRAAEVAFILEIEGAGTAKLLSDMPGKQTDVKVDVGRFVRAELSGAPDMVKITLRGGPDSLRQFTGFRNVGWTWDVEGLQVGQVDLTLKLFAEVTIDGKSQPIQIRTFQKKIPIAISVWESVKQWTSEISAMWPFLTAAASALAAVFAFFGFKPKTAVARPGNS